MPRRIELTRAALADFDDIYDYIARDSPRAAAQVLRSLDESIQLLSDQPKMGKVFRHRRLRLRLLTHDDYLGFLSRASQRHRDRPRNSRSPKYP
jgi:plasmid stabilization system protein ParE